MAEFVFSAGKQFKELLYQLKLNHPSMPIYYFYPDKFNTTPCVSYKLAGNTVLEKTIKAEPRRQESAYQVDLWGKSPEELEDLATELKTLLLKDKWSCTFEQELKDPAELYYHRSMRFAITFDNKLKIIL